MTAEVQATELRVGQFCALVNRGIEAWVEAGELLCVMVADDPEIYTTILSENPHLTRDILQSFERIGRKEVYPFLLVDGSPGARALAAFPYDSQVKLYVGKVRVVVKRGTSLEPIDKRVCDLTQKEATRAFDGNHLRSVADQMKLMRPTGQHRPARRATPALEPQPVALTALDTQSDATLEESPLGCLSRELTKAHDAMLEARTWLGMIKRGSPHDARISMALNAIGQIRFAITSGEIK